jgi:hypothetical protein
MSFSARSAAAGGSVAAAALDVARMTNTLRLVDALSGSGGDLGKATSGGGDAVMDPLTLRYLDPRLEMLYHEFRTLPNQATLITGPQFAAMHALILGAGIILPSPMLSSAQPQFQVAMQVCARAHRGGGGGGGGGAPPPQTPPPPPPPPPRRSQIPALVVFVGLNVLQAIFFTLLARLRKGGVVDWGLIAQASAPGASAELVSRARAQLEAARVFQRRSDGMVTAMCVAATGETLRRTACSRWRPWGRQPPTGG